MYMSKNTQVPEIDPHAIRVLFVPHKSDATEKQLKRIYGSVKGSQYDTVVFLETRLMDTSKKIPMPSFGEFDVDGVVYPVNDALRNEFCDEDDDFFIADVVLEDELEIRRHLPYLGEVLTDFKVVSVPVCDDDPAIVREIDYVLSELMNGRNMLLVVACGATESDAGSEELLDLVFNSDISTVMNKVNSGECRVHGAPSFIAGIMIARSWELEITFESVQSSGESLIAGVAHMLVKTSV